MKSKKKKAMEKNRNEIIMALPCFINQLLLLMHSGVILTDAFCRIADGYGRLEPKRQNYFTREVYALYAASMQNGENVIAAFCRFAAASNIKELTRVAAIMSENLNRGSDLWEKLADQSKDLWEERKRNAMSRIRVSESKMSFPLGLLLIALIMVTAAPAMLQLQ